MENYYEILELDFNFNIIDLKKKYRELVKKYHPDKYVNESIIKQNEAKNKFLKISKAYEVLSNEELRKEYDLTLTKNKKQTQQKNKKELSKEEFFINRDIFSNFFNPKSTKEKSDGNIKENINEQFKNFFGFKGMKK